MGTEFIAHINWLAVIVAGIAYFLLGAIWYSFLFKNAWIRLSGVNMNDPNLKKGVGRIMFTSLILMIIASLGIAIILVYLNPHTIMLGIKLGSLVGVCFSATAVSISYLYEKRPLGLHLINGGYNIVGCILAAIVLCLWP
jgi:hypothetical protein